MLRARRTAGLYRTMSDALDIAKLYPHGANLPGITADNGRGGMSMSTLVLDYAQPRDDARRRVIGWLESSVLAAAGILLPMLCFVVSLKRYPGGPEYQRGEWLDYLTLVPSVMASW